MATASSVNQTTITLWAVAAEIAALPVVATHWHEDNADAQQNYAMEWDELMDRLAVVSIQHAQDALSHGERAEYERVILSLRAHLALIARLDLSVPPFAQERTPRFR